MGISVISITLFILLGLWELIFWKVPAVPPVHPAVRWGCLTGRWIMEWWNRGENISLRDPWRKLVDESVQTTTARTILREIWYLHSPMLSPQRDTLTFFCFNFFSFQEVMTQTIPLSYRGDRWTIPPRVMAFWQVITLQYLKSSVFHSLFTVTLLKGEIIFFLLQGTIGGPILTVYQLLVVQYWQYINFTLLIKTQLVKKQQQQHINNELTILEIIWLFVIDPLTQQELKLNTGHTSDTLIR